MAGWSLVKRLRLPSGSAPLGYRDRDDGRTAQDARAPSSGASWIRAHVRGWLVHCETIAPSRVSVLRGHRATPLPGARCKGLDTRVPWPAGAHCTAKGGQGQDRAGEVLVPSPSPISLRASSLCCVAAWPNGLGGPLQAQAAKIGGARTGHVCMAWTNWLTPTLRSLLRALRTGYQAREPHAWLRQAQRH